MIFNLFLIIFILFLFFLFLQNFLFKNKINKKNNLIKIGIFHPHCDHGGGGERVLWMLIASILNNKKLSSIIEIIIYCTKNTQSKDIVLKNVMNKFHISISQENYSKLSFVYIPGCHLLDGSRYPYFTMLFQMFAMIYIGAICMYYYIPDIYIDTTGVPFMYPLIKLFKCQVITYIHYPLLSSDMLHKVREMRPSYNNDQRIASSQSVSNIKLYYYRTLGYLFSLTGYAVDLAFVNSTWTERHMLEMWSNSLKYSSESSSLDLKSKPMFYGPRKLIKLYPPCNTQRLQDIPLGTTSTIQQISSNKNKNIRKRNILSIGQFRPEKDHPLQILSFARFLKDNPETKYQNVQLVILGSCRNDEDEKLLNSLKNLTKSLQIINNVQFVVNAPFESLENYLKESSIGLHTMWNEHFGISIVEMLAAGLLVIAHNSGGPAMDIIPSTTGPNQIGYLAATEIEYSKCMKDAIDMLDNEETCLAIRSRGRESTKQYSDEIFETKIVDYFTQFITNCNIKS